MSKSNATWKGKGKLRRDSKSGRKMDGIFGKKINSKKHSYIEVASVDKKSHMNS